MIIHHYFPQSIPGLRAFLCLFLDGRRDSYAVVENSGSGPMSSLSTN